MLSQVNHSIMKVFSSFHWVNIFLFHDLYVSYIDRFKDTNFCLNLIPLPHLRLNNFIVTLPSVSYPSGLYFRNSAMVKREFSLLLVNYFYRTIFDRLLWVCLFWSSPRNVLYKFSYGQEAKHLVHFCFSCFL